MVRRHPKLKDNKIKDLMMEYTGSNIYRWPEDKDLNNWQLNVHAIIKWNIKPWLKFETWLILTLTFDLWPANSYQLIPECEWVPAAFPLGPSQDSEFKFHRVCMDGQPEKQTASLPDCWDHGGITIDMFSHAVHQLCKYNQAEHGAWQSMTITITDLLRNN